MVSAFRADALRDPTAELKALFAACSPTEDFPREVARHFSSVFAAHDAFKEIPVLDVRHPPSSYTSGSLVRFRAMVQDTSPSSEMYLRKTQKGGMGGWGVFEEPDAEGDQRVNYADLRECNIVWAVSVPGESSWCALELDGKDDVEEASYQSLCPHKYPDTDKTHVGIQAKIYDTATAEKLKSTDLVTFVGLMTTETLASESDTVTDVPTLHVFFMHLHERLPLSRPYPLSRGSSSSEDIARIRERAIKWIAEEALGGDLEAAEWVVLSSIARVQSRNPPLLPPTITLCSFPSPTLAHSEDAAHPQFPSPTLSFILSLLLPITHTLPLTLDLLNKSSFVPESQQEDLHAGLLQRPQGSMLVVTEGGIKEGKLMERGLVNVSAMQEVMTSQSLAYRFPYSQFSFPTDLNCIVLTEGKKSPFFKTDLHIPLRSEAATANPSVLYKSASDVAMPLEEDLASYRDLLVGAQVGKVQVSGTTSEYIQQDFVRDRQQNPAITSDDLIRRMTIAKLYALSLHHAELSVDVWERAKAFDERRKSRLV